MESACRPCPAGTYGRGQGAQSPVPARCKPCSLGYVCKAGASSPEPERVEEGGGYKCPAGHYCPGGTTIEIACPVGSYNPFAGMASVSDCRQCPPSFYSAVPGQRACTMCPASAVANKDRTGCACVGAHRRWQSKTGLCLCKPRYQWFDREMNLGSGDSKVDCQPIVYDRCQDGESRDADGNCVNGTRYCSRYCKELHDTAVGRMSSRTGHCDCLQPSMDSICDFDCRSHAPRAFVTADGTYTVQSVLGNTLRSTSIAHGDGVGFGDALAGVTCENPVEEFGCPVVHVDVTGNIAVGYVNAALSLDDGMLLTDTVAEDNEPATYSSAKTTSVYPEHGHGRFLGDPDNQYNDSVAAAGIKQPLTCIVQGNSIIFAFTTKSWIVVVRDSMLNTWDSTTDFDPEGKFDALNAQCSNSQCPDSYQIKTGPKSGNYIFGFQFSIPGTFVFALNNNLKHQFVVVVMPSGSTCPMGTYILPYTEANAIALGLEQDPTLVRKPDWNLLGWMIGGLFLSVFVIIGLLYYLRARAWNQHGSAPVYRERNRKMPMTRMHQKGSVLKTEEKEAASKFTAERKVDKPGTATGTAAVPAINLAPSMGNPLGSNGGGGGDLERWDADDLDAREILERMESNREYLMSKILGTDELISSSTSEVLAALRQETEEVRRLLAETSFMDPDGTKAKSQTLLKILENEVRARMAYDARVQTLEEDCIKGLQEVHSHFRSGVDAMVEKIVEELEPSGEAGHGSKRSKSISGLRTSVQQGARKIRKLVASFERERERRLKGITLWNAAVKHGAVELDHDLTMQLEQLRAFDEKADVACRNLVSTLRSFADGSDTFVMALGQTEIACATGIKQATDQQNPAEVTKVKRKSKKRLTSLLGELKTALEKLGIRAAKSKNDLTAARGQTAAQRKRLLLILEAQREAEGHHEEDHFDGEGGMDAKHEHEKKKLEKDLEHEENRHIKELENKMDAKAAAEMAHAHERAIEIEKIHKAELAEKGLSEDLQNKLFKQLDKDRDAMAAMMDEQRQRQSETMRARLAERRMKRKKQLAQRHHAEKSEEGILATHQQTGRELAEQQKQEYEQVVAQITAEEKRAAEDFMARDADEEFQIGKISSLEELERLQKQLQEDLRKNGDSMDEGRKADHERLLRKLELKKMQLMKKNQAQMDIAEAKARNDEAAIQRIQDQYKHDITNLKQAADSEKRRQQESVANRLKRRREAKMRELKRKHESEKHAVEHNHAAEAGQIQEQLEDDDNLRKTIEEAKVDALQDESVSAGKEDLNALIDEQSKMRDAIQKRHNEERKKLEEETEVDDALSGMDDAQELALAQLKMEADAQAVKGQIEGSRLEARKKLLAKLAKQKAMAKKRQMDVLKAQKILAEKESEMNEQTKSEALAKVREMERQQREMEAEIASNLEKLESDVSSFRSAMQDKQTAKRFQLKQKLEERRKLKAAAEAKEEKLQLDLVQNAAKMSEATRKEKEEALIQAQNERRNLEKEVSNQQSKFEQESERVRGRMKDKQARQRDRMLEKLEKKRRMAEQEERKKRREVEMAKLQIQKQAQLEKERLAQSGAQTEEAVKSLQNRLETEMMRQKAKLEGNRDKQKERMRKRLAAKRAKKALELKKAQQEEMQDEMREQEKERHDQEGKTAKAAEVKMLEGIMIRGADENRIDEAIEMVMHERHAKETSNLISRQYSERTSVLKEALEDLFVRKAKERTEMLDRLKAENAEEAIVLKALEQLEDKYQVLQSNVQMDATSTLDKHHAEEQLALRQQQLQEISHAFEELAPEDVLKQKQAERAQRQQEELEEFKESMKREEEEQIERIRAEKAKVEEEMRKKHDEELREMEREHSVQLEKERLAAEEKLKSRREKLLKEQEEQQNSHMAELGKVSAKERELMLKRFREDRERVQAIMAAERDRQQRALEEKLRMRRMRRALRQESALRERMKLEHKRMQKRIQAVNSTMQSVVSGMSQDVMKAGRKKHLFQGEGSAVHMSIIGNLADKWKKHGEETKKKAKEAMKALENGTPAERRAARDAKKGFWAGNEQDTEAAEAQRKEKEKKEALEQVKKLQQKMEDELNKKGAEMTDRQRRQHERLLKKLELKKKRAAAAAEKEAKKAKKAAEKHVEEKVQKLKDEPIASGFGAIAASEDGTPSTEKTSAAPAMEMPTYSQPIVKQAPVPGAAGGFAAGAIAFDPVMEKKMLDKLNHIEKMLETVSVSRSGTSSYSAGPSTSFEDEEDYSNASLSERLGRYKAFQENPQLVDFLHRVDHTA